MARKKAIQRIETDFVEGLEEALIFGKGNSPLQRHLRGRLARGNAPLKRDVPKTHVRTVKLTQAELLRCEIGRHLNQIRKASKISKAALAKIAGVTVRMLNDILESRIDKFTTDQALECLERVSPGFEIVLTLGNKRIRPHRPPNKISADEIADLADAGQDISRHFTNKGSINPKA